MSFEKYNKTIYFFNSFTGPIDDKIVKKMSNILYVEFVNYHDFYDPKVIEKNYYTYSKKTHLNNFNNSIDLFPPHIKSIILSDKFNQLVNNLPIKLKQLIFGTNFNQLVDNLPPKLIKLIFGNNFNQQINNLPPIKIIRLGMGFRQTLDYLPSSIIYLELNYDLMVKNLNLPSSIKFIILEGESSFNKLKNLNQLDNILPNTKILITNNDKYLRNKKIRL